MRTRTLSMIVAALILLAIALPTMAQNLAVYNRPTPRLLESLDAAKRGNFDSLAAIAYGSKGTEAGIAARTLGHYSNKAGNAKDAYRWWGHASLYADREIAAEALGCQGYLLVRWGNHLPAVKKFQAAAERSGDTAVKSEMNFRAGKCYVALAQANPTQPQRSWYKEQATLQFELSGTDAAYTESLGIRYENILDSEVPIIGVPIKDNWLKWLDDYEAFKIRCVDQEALATASVMAMEIWFDHLNNPSKVIELGREINLNWREHRKQAAWSRIVWGGCYQDQGRYKEAIEMYLSIPRDFKKADNFRGNDVIGLAKELAKICDRMQKEKEAQK